GRGSPSLFQSSQPISASMYSASNPDASRTVRAAAMTSGPMPSPGSQAMTGRRGKLGVTASSSDHHLAGALKPRAFHVIDVDAGDEILPSLGLEIPSERRGRRRSRLIGTMNDGDDVVGRFGKDPDRARRGKIREH